MQEVPKDVLDLVLPLEDRGKVVPSCSELLDKILPLWEDCVLVSEQDRFILAQLECMWLKAIFSNWVIETEKSKIMKRLRMEKAKSLGCAVDELYMYYPHKTVHKEYPLTPQWWTPVNEKDQEVLNRAFKKSGTHFSARDTLHLESIYTSL